jgi:hypothetical protein
MMETFKCNQCGICCEKYGHNLQADTEDIGRWYLLAIDPLVSDKVSDLASELLSYTQMGKVGMGVDLWISGKTYEEMNRCPYYRKTKKGNYCRLHKADPRLKPNVCSQYPVDKEQKERDKCEGEYIYD